MTTVELIIIIVLVGYAIYRQTRTTEITGRGRFQLALSYGVVGICLGLHFPHTATALALIAAGVLAGVVVGLLRGKYTRLWQDDGRIYSRGTPLTIGLFLGLIAFKFGLGTIAYLTHTRYENSMGEVLVMIAIMLAVQAELIRNRVRHEFGTAGTGELVGAGR